MRKNSNSGAASVVHRTGCGVIVALCSVFGLTSTAGAASCDRNCLTSVADKYLDALVAHDPKKLALAANFRMTENAALSGLDKGLWQSAERVVSRQYFLDPQSGELLIYAMVKVKDRELLNAYGVRLKVANRKIEEAEAIVREPDAAAGNALMPPDTLYDALMPKERRMSREALIAAADRYYTAISSGNAVDAISHCVATASIPATSSTAKPA